MLSKQSHKIIRKALRAERINIEMSDLEYNHRASEFAVVDAAVAEIDALATHPAPVAGLPMPDGPGFWAGKSEHREFVVHWTYFREDGNAICVCWQGDNYLTRYPLEQFRHDYRDVTWFKLTMPWKTDDVSAG